MQKKKLKKRKFKIASLLFMCVAAVMMLCTMLSINVYAATDTATTTTTSKDSYVPEDPTIYDTNWSKANVKHWLYQKPVFKVFWKTYSYIRITDKNGKFINDITRLEATYIRNGEQVHINQKLDENVSVWNTSEDGQLTTWREHCDNSVFGLDSYEECLEEFNDFKSCNFVWRWNAKVTEIVYLYVWYLDPTTGEELAASFCPNGEHPKYDSEGKLTGIYNTEGELLEKYTLNEKGIPSMIATDGTLTPVLTPEDQLVDSVIEEGNSVSSLIKLWTGSAISKSSNNFSFMNVIYIMAAIFIAIVLLAILIKFIIWLFKKAGGKK